MSKNFITKFIFISFISVIITRIIPHPPNFTSAVAVMFYLPALFGLKLLFVPFSAFLISDLFIGFHHLILFTWGSFILIGLISKYFKNLYFRFLGITLSCFLFFILSNLGVWILTNTYNHNFSGLIDCYIMGLPFLQNSILSSLVFAAIIEFLISMNFVKSYIARINASLSY